MSRPTALVVIFSFLVVFYVNCAFSQSVEEPPPSPEAKFSVMVKLQRIITRMYTMMKIIKRHEQGISTKPLPKLAKLLQANGGRKLINSIEKLLNRLKLNPDSNLETQSSMATNSEDLEKSKDPTTITSSLPEPTEMPQSQNTDTKLHETKTTTMENPAPEVRATESNSLQNQQNPSSTKPELSATQNDVTAQGDTVGQQAGNGNAFSFSFDDTVGRDQIILDLNKAYQAHLARKQNLASSSSKSRVKRNSIPNPNSPESFEDNTEDEDESYLAKNLSKIDPQNPANDEELFTADEADKLYNLIDSGFLVEDLKKLRNSKIKGTQHKQSKQDLARISSYLLNKKYASNSAKSYRRQTGEEGDENVPSPPEPSNPGETGEPSNPNTENPGTGSMSDDDYVKEQLKLLSSMKNYDTRNFTEKSPKHERRTFSCGVNTNEGRKMCDSICTQVGFEVICHGPYCSCFKSPEEGDTEDSEKNSRQCGPNTSFGRLHCRKSCNGPNDRISCTELSCFCSRHRNVYKGNPEVDGAGRNIFGHLGQYYYCGTAIGHNNCSDICRGWGHVTCGELACYCDRGGSK